MTTEVKGARELSVSMRVAADDIGDMAAAEAKAAAHLKQVAQGKAPRLSGALAASLTTDVAAGTVEVGSGLVYAGRTHYGWPAVGQRAQPFLTDALAETEDQTVGYFEDEVDRAIGRIRGA